jgi:hypothetical protein
MYKQLCKKVYKVVYNEKNHAVLYNCMVLLVLEETYLLSG